MAKRRQVVLIMTDTQRWDMVNCYRKTGLQDAEPGPSCRWRRQVRPGPIPASPSVGRPGRRCSPGRIRIPTARGPIAWPWATTVQDDRPATSRQRRSLAPTSASGTWTVVTTSASAVAHDGWDDTYWYDMRRYLEELTPAERLRVAQDEHYPGGRARGVHFRASVQQPGGRLSGENTTTRTSCWSFPTTSRTGRFCARRSTTTCTRTSNSRFRPTWMMTWRTSPSTCGPGPASTRARTASRCGSSVPHSLGATRSSITRSGASWMAIDRHCPAGHGDLHLRPRRRLGLAQNQQQGTSHV